MFCVPSKRVLMASVTVSLGQPPMTRGRAGPAVGWSKERLHPPEEPSGRGLAGRGETVKRMAGCPPTDKTRFSRLKASPKYSHCRGDSRAELRSQALVSDLDEASRALTRPRPLLRPRPPRVIGGVGPQTEVGPALTFLACLTRSLENCGAHWGSAGAG